MIEDGVDKDQARTERLDSWITWEAEERVAMSAQSLSFLSLLHIMLRGTHTPSFAHSATTGAEDFLSLSSVRALSRLVSFIYAYMYGSTS